MDYTKASLRFKLQKTARYVSLYGINRTLMKIRGQYHMNSEGDFPADEWENPQCKSPDSPDRRVAIIGCGNYAFSNIAYYLQKEARNFLRATYDPSRSRSLSLCRAYGGAYAAGDPEVIIKDTAVSLVFIASNHASHAEYAIRALDAGKDVHIEKPHVVTEDQLRRLVQAMERNPAGKVFLGFNRPKSVLFRELAGLLDQEKGPLMINWFIAGHEIPEDHWYFDEKEGGRVLGNLCHWTDLVLHLVGFDHLFPCTIVPATPPGAKSDFVVSVIFGDRSCSTITFSAKGHTFEGVREILNVHKGNLLANLSDFQSLTYEVDAKKKTKKLRHRDHGHGQNFLHSFRGSQPIGHAGESVFYTAVTAKVFLAIREVIDTGRTIVIERDDIDSLMK